jgi:hypothetical protein
MTRRALATLLFVLPSTLAAQPARGATHTGSSAITNTTVITMGRTGVLRDATVIIHNGTIAEVGPSSRIRVPRGVTTIDGRGKYVIPGLSDMHVHLHADDTAPDSIGRYELGVMLAHGITTVRFMIGTPLHFTLRDAVARGAVAGPQIWIASPEISGNTNPHGIQVTDIASARRAVAQVADSGYDFLKLTTNLTPELYDVLIAEAAARRLRVVGHVDPRIGARRAIAAGQQIEHLDSFMEDVLADTAPSRLSTSDVGAYRTAQWTSLDFVDDRKVEQLAGLVARSGEPVDPTLVFFREWFGNRPLEAEIEARPDYGMIPAPSRAPWMRTLVAMRRNPPTPERRARFIAVRNRMVKAIVDSGGLVMAGSDSPGGMMTYGWMLHRELLALRDAGLTAEQVLAAATTTPAAFLGGTPGFGRVAEGLRADLVVLDADPLVDVANTQRISHVVSGGRWFNRAELDALVETARVRLAAVAAPPTP